MFFTRSPIVQQIYLAPSNSGAQRCRHHASPSASNGLLLLAFSPSPSSGATSSHGPSPALRDAYRSHRVFFGLGVSCLLRTHGCDGLPIHSRGGRECFDVLLEFCTEFEKPKVMKTLQDLEVNHRSVGASLLRIFFPCDCGQRRL